MKAKRILAGFVAMAMTMGMMSSLVLADEAENTPDETSVVETTEPKEKETKKPEEKKPAETKEADPEPEKKPDETVKETEPADSEEKKPAETTETEPAQPSEKKPAESKEEEPSKPAETEPEQSSVPTEEKEPEATVAPEHGGKSDTHSVPPKNEQTSTEEISSVSVTIDAPRKHAKPDYTAGFPSGANYYSEAFSNEYYENYIRWLDVTDNSFMNKDSAVFKDSHEYQVVLFLTAKEGYSFSKNTTATVNENVAKTSIDEEGHLRVAYNFPKLKKEINYVTVDLDAPVVGAKPDYNAVFFQDADYYSSIINNENYHLNIGWLDVTTGTYVNTKSGVFKAGHQYKVSVILTAKDGCYFHVTSAYLNGKTPETSMHGDELEITYTFPKLEGEATDIITSVDVTIDAPVAGTKPDYEADFPSGANYFSNAYNLDGFRNDIRWYDVTIGDNVNPSNGVFKAGHQYKVYVYLTAKDDYCFSADATSTLNGKTAETSHSKALLVVIKTFPKLEGEATDIIPLIAATIDVPVVGAKPDTTAAVPADAKYSINIYEFYPHHNGVAWYDITEKAYLDPDNTVFKAGHEYYVDISILPKDGYYFNKNKVSSMLNGQATDTLYEEVTRHIRFRFPELKSLSVGNTAIVGGYNYTITNNNTDGTGTVTLTGVANQRASVSIPATVVINGYVYKVNRIGAKAFYGDTTIRTLSIGANVVIIDGSAFYGCSNLTTVSGGKGLKTIGSSAFAKCSKLKSFSIASAVLSKIGTYAFNKDSKLKTISIKYTTKLTKSGVKKSLKGSKVKTVKVKKSKVKKYKKYFKKSNSGRSVKVKK